MSAGPRLNRPVLRYHGGKWTAAPWIISHFPPHRTYVEPYGGGASVLLRKAPAPAEIYNELDGAIVNVFRVLRDPVDSRTLLDLLKLTPYAREEFLLAYQPCDNQIERARRTIVRSFMGFGGDGTMGKYTTGFRARVTEAKKLPASEWFNYPDQLWASIRRLRRVVIENRAALDIIGLFDSAETLHFVDPPYLPSTRSRGNRRRGAGFHVYTHELEEDDHVKLLEALRSLKGMVVLSGYPSELYEDALADWRRVERKAYADGGRPRTEVIWINPNAVEALRHAGSITLV